MSCKLLIIIQPITSIRSGWIVAMARAMTPCIDVYKRQVYKMGKNVILGRQKEMDDIKTQKKKTDAFYFL